MKNNTDADKLSLDFSQLDFARSDEEKGLIPAIVQDHRNGCVLMLGYMNRDALRQTLSTGHVTFYSRSRKRLWTKGETSGNRLLVREILPDCDGDALLIRAIPTGPICHTGSAACFAQKSAQGFLYRLEEIVEERKREPRTESYTTSLFAEGVDGIAQKVGEEAVELVIAAKGENDNRFLNEAADLFYHVLVLLSDRGYNLEDVEEVLKGRSRQKRN